MFDHTNKAQQYANTLMFMYLNIALNMNYIQLCAPYIKAVKCIN